MKRILFVCLGNICRSPTAEAVFASRAAGRRDLPELELDSCGTGGWHIGKPADARAQAAARTRGYDMSALRARQVEVADFYRFDYIFAMDSDNLRDLESMRPADSPARVALFLSLLPQAHVEDVPDPYYGGDAGFERVLDLIEDASDALLEHLARGGDGC